MTLNFGCPLFKQAMHFRISGSGVLGKVRTLDGAREGNHRTHDMMIIHTSTIPRQHLVMTIEMTDHSR
jgi:hypothetical protein